MPIYRAIITGIFFLFIFSCQKNENPDPPEPSPFEMTVHNDFNFAEAEYAVFLSDEEGLVRAFRWLPGNDTARVSVADAQPDEIFDCTVVRVTSINVPGTGVFDTTVVLTTYTHRSNGDDIYLRSPDFVQTTDLQVTLTNFNTLDSIVVPDGLTFDHPRAGNNYEGQYRVLHSGRIWLRLLINGETKWRYAMFDPVSSATLSVTVDAAALPQITAAPAAISLPFFANWNCRIDRVINTGQQQFLAIGGNIAVPGGAAPYFDQLDVYEPTNPSTGTYRLRMSGTDVTPGSYTYICDRLMSPIPAILPEPNFDVQQTTVTGPRVIAVKCIGDFDLLSLTRTQNGTTNFRWEALVAPANSTGGIVTYRLPDVPKDLSGRFPRLKNYEHFGSSVRVRAERYDLYNSYQSVIEKMLLLNDPLWQMKGGYLARERTF